MNWQKDLEMREAHLKAGGGAAATTGDNNWPICCPFSRNDITEDIGTDSVEAAVCTRAYWALLANFVLLPWNFICMLTYACGGNNDNKFSAIGLSFAYVIAGFPGAYYMWYRVLYIACAEKTTATYYFIVLATLAMSFLFWVAHCVGIPGTGMAGVILGIMQFDQAGKDDGVGAYLICGIMQCIFLIMAIPLCVVKVYLWIMVRQLYNAAGGDAAAKAAAASMGVGVAAAAMQNETIRNAAVSGAAAGVSAGAKAASS